MVVFSTFSTKCIYEKIKTTDLTGFKPVPPLSRECAKSFINQLLRGKFNTLLRFNSIKFRIDFVAV